MSNLEWFPADWVDETCPPSKGSPDAFIVAVTGGFELGYIATGEGHLGERVAREYCELYNKPLAVGEIVNFMTCERLGNIEATFQRDGTMTFHQPVPGSYSVVIINHDSDLLYDSLDELAKQLKTPDQWCNPAEYIFDKDADTAEVTLSFASWSDLLPHLFEIENGKPLFRPVPERKN